MTLSMNVICSFFQLSFETSGAEQIEFGCVEVASNTKMNSLTRSHDEMMNVTRKKQTRGVIVFRLIDSDQTIRRDHRSKLRSR